MACRNPPSSAAHSNRTKRPESREDLQLKSDTDGREFLLLKLPVFVKVPGCVGDAGTALREASIKPDRGCPSAVSRKASAASRLQRQR